VTGGERRLTRFNMQRIIPFQRASPVCEWGWQSHGFSPRNLALRKLERYSTITR